jgi:hypothetical protein
MFKAFVDRKDSKWVDAVSGASAARNAPAHFKLKGKDEKEFEKEIDKITTFLKELGVDKNLWEEKFKKFKDWKNFTNITKADFERIKKALNVEKRYAEALDNFAKKIEENSKQLEMLKIHEEKKRAVESAIARIHPFSVFNRDYMDKKRGKREGAHLKGQFRYVGRDWLFEKVKNWMVDAEGKRTMLLLADAGFGKSAFVAQLVDEKMKDSVVAYHFCANERKSTLDQDAFMVGLVVSLAKVESFKKKLMELVAKKLGADYQGLVEEVFGENR